MRYRQEYDPNMDEYAGSRTADVVPLLAAFDAAATEGHITRAAQILDVPQSSLSRRIKTLEKILGVALFQPLGRRVELTASGRDLHRRTHALVRALDDAIGVVQGNADPEHGSVRFGFPLTLGAVSVPRLLAEFHAEAPGIRFELVQAHSRSLAQMVRDGRLDLAIVVPPPDDLPTVELGRQRIHLYAAPTHPLAGRGHVELAELRDAVFIANPPTYDLRRMLEQWCAESGFIPNIAFEIGDFDTVRALVAQGLGVALLPAAESDGDPVTVAIGTGRERSVGLVVGRHRPTPAVARFREHVVTRATVYVPQSVPDASGRRGAQAGEHLNGRRPRAGG